MLRPYKVKGGGRVSNPPLRGEVVNVPMQERRDERGFGRGLPRPYYSRRVAGAARCIGGEQDVQNGEFLPNLQAILAAESGG